ncbi:protein-glutamate O-methyltransferase CheR [Deltaproteobacteria bacterium TL4]
MMLTVQDLQKFAEIAYTETGIRISDQKLELMNNRLGRRIKELGLESFKHYYDYLRKTSSEMPHFVESITTNETYFFRCPKHFTLLSKQVFSGISTSQVDVWSAASSTGEEPYSLAIALSERLPNFQGRQVRLFASDIDYGVLKKASEGIYNSYALRLVTPDLLKKYFLPHSNNYKIADSLRKMVLLGQHNLKLPFPKGKVDILFCRNVLIYFDDASKQIVFNNLINALKPGGYLFLGESEIIPELSGMHRVEASVAQKMK